MEDSAIIGLYFARDETRVFSEYRAELDAEGVIPAMPEEDIFSCDAHYEADGRVYSVVFRWYSYDPYSSLTVTAAPEKRNIVSDEVDIPVGENGRVIDPAVTVTERDGVYIVAEGWESGSKSISFETASGWYKIEGHASDSFESLTALLDWFWEHPVDFEFFPITGGDHYTFEGLDDRFADVVAHIPDLSGLGCVPANETQGVMLKNGAFYSTEVCFEEAEKSDESSGRGVWWLLKAVPDAEEEGKLVGNLADLTFDDVAKVRAERQIIYFTWDGYCVGLYVGSNVTAGEMWAIIGTVR